MPPRKRLGVFLGLLCAFPAQAQAPSDPNVSMEDFACAMYRELARDDENLLFSPFSIAVALAMTAEGARGETALQMGEVLGLDAALRRDDAQRPYDWTPVHAALGTLAERLASRAPSAAQREELTGLRAGLDAANAALEKATDFGPAYSRLAEQAQALADDINRRQKAIDPTDFHVANALWLERSFAPEPSYLGSLAQHYDTGGAMMADFRADPDGARQRINDWVAVQTRERIRDLLPPGTVDATTRLVLTNAVYFLAEWLEPFDAKRTREESFRLRDGTRIDLPSMRGRKSEEVRYAAFNADGSPFATPLQVPVGDPDDGARYPRDGFQLVELPYRGGQWVMQILLPARADGLLALETMLDAAHLERWNGALAQRDVDVTLPRYKLEFGTELSPVLQRLGMARAFVNPLDTQAGAQFDGISRSHDPARRLYIGAVVHKAFMQVDEKGTEAAAATAVEMLAGAAAAQMVDFTPVFRADRPFVFLIRDRSSGTVLFLGRVLRPIPA